MTFSRRSRISLLLVSWLITGLFLMHLALWENLNVLMVSPNNCGHALIHVIIRVQQLLPMELANNFVSFEFLNGICKPD